MKLASAQIDCNVGEIQQNLEKHFELIEIAINNGVEFILFPEMSITGYCRSEAAELFFTPNDVKINKLRELSFTGDIVIVAGAPIRIKNQLHIGSFIMYPDKTIDIYTKQYLHKGEELYYSSTMDNNPLVKMGNEKIALAICADIDNPDHPSEARKNGATVYAPSIFFSKDGMLLGHQTLQHYAVENKLNILMSNYNGNHWGIDAGGKSGFWNDDGLKLGTLDEKNSGLVMVEKIKDNWNVTTLANGKDIL